MDRPEPHDDGTGVCIVGTARRVNEGESFD